MGQFDNELALFVLLAGLEGALVLPAEWSLAAFAEDVGDRVEPGQEETLLRGTAAHVDHRVEEVGAALTSLWEEGTDGGGNRWGREIRGSRGPSHRPREF